MPQYFSGNPLDRGEAERRDDGWLETAKRDPGSRFLLLHNLKILVSKSGGGGAHLCWLGPEILDRLGWDAPEPILLGLDGGRIAHFAVDATSVEPESLSLPGGAAFEDARAIAAELPIPETGIIAQAKAQVDWHDRHRFCGRCGGETVPERGGQQRRCRQCQAEHFPRTDPVVIVLVHDGDRCLLGQSRLWGIRGTFYSCLSGFMDHGESIEEAVQREVREEAGLELESVVYVASQPWPFPASLMIGCHAAPRTTEVRFDEEEMNDVRWFERDEVLAALNDDNPRLRVPGKIAIGGHLIRTWAEGGFD